MIPPEILIALVVLAFLGMCLGVFVWGVRQGPNEKIKGLEAGRRATQKAMDGVARVRRKWSGARDRVSGKRRDDSADDGMSDG